MSGLQPLHIDELELQAEVDKLPVKAQCMHVMCSVQRIVKNMVIIQILTCADRLSPVLTELSLVSCSNNKLRRWGKKWKVKAMSLCSMRSFVTWHSSRQGQTRGRQSQTRWYVLHFWLYLLKFSSHPESNQQIECHPCHRLWTNRSLETA